MTPPDSESPTSAMPEREHARRLLARTGFGPAPATLAEWAGVAQPERVPRWVASAVAAPLPEPPEWARQPPEPFDTANRTDEYRQAYFAGRRARIAGLRTWWLRQMVESPVPLRERMTLYWHNHFTSSLQKVTREHLIYRQHALLRQHALGNYRELLHAMARDPAMLWYLDGRENRKAAPNENFARELLELFTLGEGHYSEADIKAAARAFTGWVLEPDDTPKFLPRRHDAGEKLFMGERGDFDGDDIIEIILRQPRTAEYLVTRLWREFISPEADPAAVARLAASFRKDYEIAPLLTALLQEPAFSAPENAGRLVKSPVELVVGSLRLLGLPAGEGKAYLTAMADMGQQLFEPPNVKGWPVGVDWINANTLLARRQFLSNLAGEPAAAEAPGAGRREAQRAFAAVAESLDAETAQSLVLAVAPLDPPDEGATPIQRLFEWLMDPAYQVK